MKWAMANYMLQLIYYCVIFSIICVCARAGNPVNILYFYPKKLQDHVLKLGLTSKRAMVIKRNIVMVTMILVMTINLYFIICIWNKADNFKSVFYQALFFLQLWNVYDGVVMDKLWPENSNFWIIPEIKDMWEVPSWFEVLKKRLVYVPFLLLLSVIAAKLFLLF